MTNELQRQAKTLTLVILFIVIIVFAIQQLSAPFKDGLKVQDITGALGALFIIVLLVERVIEIFTSIWRDPDANTLKQKINKFTDEQKKSRETNVLDAEKNLANYKAKTQSITLLTSFTLAVVICAAGVGLLSEIINLPATAPNSQKTFIRGIDIVLTAGLIAGGSDGFHHFVNSFVTFFKKLQENAE